VRPRERPHNAMCVQHKWPSANINNRRGKYTVRDDARFPSPPPRHALPGEGRGWGLRGARCGDGCGRRAAARRGVMEPLSLDNFIGIGIGVQRRGERAQSSDPEGEGDGGSGGGRPAMGTTFARVARYLGVRASNDEREFLEKDEVPGPRFAGKNDAPVERARARARVGRNTGAGNGLSICSGTAAR